MTGYPGRTHGIRATYVRGCRCEPCATAHREYDQARTPPPDAQTVALAHTPPPGDWYIHGRCRGMNTDLFFVVRGESTQPAKTICGQCPVLYQCRAYALAQPDSLVGVWGSMSARERRAIRKQGRGAA